jgi:hypothetical protein
MQIETGKPSEIAPMDRTSQNPEDPPAGLPRGVVRALWLLDQLDAQADQIRHSVNEMAASVAAALSGD